MGYGAKSGRWKSKVIALQKRTCGPNWNARTPHSPAGEGVQQFIDESRTRSSLDPETLLNSDHKFCSYLVFTDTQKNRQTDDRIIPSIVRGINWDQSTNHGKLDL